MTTPRLPSAEELAADIHRRADVSGPIAALALSPDMIRDYARKVLEAAAEVVKSGEWAKAGIAPPKFLEALAGEILKLKDTLP